MKVFKDMIDIKYPTKLSLQSLRHDMEQHNLQTIQRINPQKAKSLYILYYIQLYKMTQTTILHSPTLESVIMVEKTIQKHSQECGKYQLWKKLPKKMMYQTFQVILDYLQNSGKILIDKDGCVIWTYDPKGIKKLISTGLKLR